MTNNKRKVLFMLIVLSIFISNNIFAQSSDVPLESGSSRGLRVDGNNAVWMAYVDGNWDVYHLDLSTGIKTNITNDPSTQGYPDVWDKYIVWQDNRDHKEGAGYFDIYLYDMDTKTETKISNVEGDHIEPIIKNGKVVWIDNQSGNRDIMLYDIQDQTLEKVSSDESLAFGLCFDGNVIAWSDRRGSSFDMYIYDISKKEEKQITYGLGDETDSIVDDGKVVWMVEHNGFNQIYMYDTKTGLETKLTVGQEDHRPIAFSNGELLIIENDHLALNNVEKITEQSISAPDGTIPKQAFMDNNRIVWLDGERLIVDSIQSALNRKIDNTKPNTNNSQGETTGDTIVGKNVESKDNDEDKVLIKAGKDNIVKSKDGILIFKFPKGSFKNDVYMRLTKQEVRQKDNYIPITSLYKWEIDGNEKPLLPVEVSMNYGNIKIKDNDNDMKISIYTMNNGNLPNIVRSIRNHKENVLTTKIIDDNNAALMTYSKVFNDMKGHWAEKIVDVIASHQIIDGYKDGSFKPDEEMTRAEFVKVLVSSVYNEEEISSSENKNEFKDIAPEFWAAPYINVAHQKGWVDGFEGRFNPNQSITREQMITILMRAYEDISENNRDDELVKVELTKYRDEEKISPWAYEFMEKAVSSGIVQGNNNELQPLNNATRAEAATMLYRYLERVQRL